MKISKISAAIAAAAMAVSMMAVNASATNWANATYADNDPNTCKIISVDEEKAVYTATADGLQAKLKVCVGDLLDNPEAVKSATWDITYDFSNATEAGTWLGGGTWFGCKNSTGYDAGASIAYGEDGAPSGYAEPTFTTSDSAKFLLDTEVLSAESELCFIDWSDASAKLASNNITITISNLKFFDADGNEIAQKAFAGAAAPAPEADADTTAAATGNAPIAGIAAVMALAGAAAIASKKN